MHHLQHLVKRNQHLLVILFPLFCPLILSIITSNVSERSHTDDLVVLIYIFFSSCGQASERGESSDEAINNIPVTQDEK